MFKSKKVKVIVGLIAVLVGVPTLLGVIVGGGGGEMTIDPTPLPVNTSTSTSTDEMVVVLTEIKRIVEAHSEWSTQWVEPCYLISDNIFTGGLTGLDARGELLWSIQDEKVTDLTASLLRTQYEEESTRFPWVDSDGYSPMLGVGGYAGWTKQPHITAQNLRNYYATEATSVDVTEASLIGWLYLKKQQRVEFNQAFRRWVDEEWTMCSDWMRESNA